MILSGSRYRIVDCLVDLEVTFHCIKKNLCCISVVKLIKCRL